MAEGRGTNGLADDGPEPGDLIIPGVLLEASLAPLALLLGWLVGQPPLSGFAWNARDAAIGVLATGPLLALFFLIVRWPVGPLGRIEQICDETLRPVLEGCTWPDLALLAVAAGVGEEMLFRGVLQGALGQWLGPWMGLALAAPIFGMAHPITPTYAVLVSLIGAYLGAVWMFNGNLLTVMVAHAVYDFIALVVLLRERTA